MFPFQTPSTLERGGFQLPIQIGARQTRPEARYRNTAVTP